jgi:putative oxidoreductase
MAKGTSRLTDPAFALLRVASGLLFAQHGLQKVFGLLGGTRVAPASELGLAGFIELICGVMIAAGVFPRWAALIASGEMAFAYFTRHAPQALWPVVNRGELAVLYCFIFLYIAARGGGRWTIRD